MSNLKRTTRALGESLGARTKGGKLGREDGVLRGPHGTYYVREVWTDGRTMPAIALRAARGAQFPVQVNVAVRLGYDSTRRRVILGSDDRAMEVQGLNPRLTNPLDPQNQLVRKDQLQPLRCRPSQDPTKPMFAEVLPDRFVMDATYYDWPGGDIDLSGEVPSSGDHCYTVVFWRSSTNDLEIASSTPQGTGTPLDATDVQEAIDAADTDVIAVKAFLLTGDMTALNGDSTHALDIRTTFSPGGGGGAGTVTSVGVSTDASYLTVGSSPVISAGTITLNKTTGLPGNRFVGTPDGTMGAAELRALASGDIPSLDASKITTGQIALARGGTHADLSATGGAHSFLKQASTGADITLAVPVKADISDLETITATPTANAVPKADGSNKLAAGWISEVLGLTDLSDVALSGVATDDILIKGSSTWNNLAVAASRIIGKKATGAIGALTGSEVKTILAIVSADISDLAATLAAYITKATFTAKGSLIGASASATPVELTVGANNTILTADSTQASGLKWATGPVTSLFQHFADAGNTTTGETDLYSDTTPAGTLANNGDVIAAFYSGITVASGTATRTFRAYFAGSVMFDSGAITTAAADTWRWEVRITRESSTVVRCSILLSINGVTITTYTGYTRLTGLTLSGTNILKITGQAGGVGAATNDIVAKEGVILLPASASALGANTALSNLASVAINSSLLFDTDNVYNVASSAAKVQNVFAYRVTLDEGSAPSAPGAGDLLDYANALHYKRRITSGGQDDAYFAGETPEAFSFANSTAANAALTKVIKANALGTKGWIRSEIDVIFTNSSGATHTLAGAYNFGAFSFAWGPITLTTGTNALTLHMVVYTFNDAAAAAQMHLIIIGTPATGQAAGASPALAPVVIWQTSAIDTTVDVTVTQTTTMNATANANCKNRGIVSIQGPNNN